MSPAALRPCCIGACPTGGTDLGPPSVDQGPGGLFGRPPWEGSSPPADAVPGTRHAAPRAATRRRDTRRAVGVVNRRHPPGKR